jgi:hypothetical protein
MQITDTVKTTFDEMNPWEFIDLLRAETKKKLRGNIDRAATKKLADFTNFVIAEMAHDFGIEINVDTLPVCYAVKVVEKDGIFTLPMEGFNDASGTYLINSNMILVGYSADIEMVEGYQEYDHFAHAPLIGSIEKDIPFSQYFTKLALHEIAHFWDHFYFNTRVHHGRTFRFAYGMLMYRYGTVNILA